MDGDKLDTTRSDLGNPSRSGCFRLHGHRPLDSPMKLHDIGTSARVVVGGRVDENETGNFGGSAANAVRDKLMITAKCSSTTRPIMTLKAIKYSVRLSESINRVLRCN